MSNSEKHESSFLRRETKKDRLRREEREEKERQTVTRRLLLFARCLEGERLGPHPGRVEIRIEFRAYEATRQVYRTIPGLKIECGVDSVEALIKVRDAAESGIALYLEGRLVCEKCGEGV